MSSRVPDVQVFLSFLHSSVLRSTDACLLVFLLTHLPWGSVTRCLFEPLELQHDTYLKGLTRLDAAATLD